MNADKDQNSILSTLNQLNNNDNNNNNIIIGSCKIKIYVIISVFLLLCMTREFISPTPAVTPTTKSVSNSSEIKIGHYIITMDGVAGVSKANTGRLKTFQSRWDEMCTKLDDAVVLTGITPSSSIETCMGLNHPLRGVGLSMTFSICISKALKSNYDFAFFYEDDATLFDEKFCSKDYQQVSKRTETNSPKTKLIIILAETYKLLSIRRSSYAAGRTPFQGEKRGPLRPFYSQCFRPIEGFSRQVSERSERALMKTKILTLDESTPAK